MVAYSQKKRALIVNCVLFFFKSKGGINNQKLGALVLNKFDNWKRAIKTFNKHAKLNYRLKSIAGTDNFLKAKNNRSVHIVNQLDTARSKQIREIRKNILPIIEVIILCGRQDLSNRGHRDFGKINLETIQTTNEENFRQFLRYRARGDSRLKTFL